MSRRTGRAKAAWTAWSHRTRSLALGWTAAVVSGIVLVVIGTQPAAAALPALGGRSGALDLPKQRLGSAAGLPHQVPASATRARNSKHASHPPKTVTGTVPLPSKARSGTSRSSFRPKKSQFTGKTVHPPASAHPSARVATRGSDASLGDAHLPGPAAAGSEVKADRTATTSVFQNGDGTLTARVYSRPVHYRGADGSWADIDNTLTKRSNGRWEERADAPSANFAASGDASSLVSYGPSPTERVSYGLNGARSVTGKASGDSITYPGIRASSDLTYAATASGVKESLVLHGPSAPTTWTFPLATTGLTPSVASDGSIVFKDSAGTVRETIPHGFMEDAHVGKVSDEGAISTGVTYRLTDIDGRRALRVSLDSSWLHDPARVFPVTVDPTDLNASSSTYVETPYDINFSTDDTLKVGSYDGGSHKANSYVLFWSTGTTFKNDYIEKASLYLDNVWSGGCTPRQVNVAPITSSWTVGSIANYPGLSYGSKVGSADFAAGASCDGSAWHGVDLGDNPSAGGVKVIENWAHGGTNLGLALSADNTDVAAWKQFASVNSSYPPYLSVTYSTYGADYTVPAQSYTEPTGSTTGSMQVKITNRGTSSWTASNMKLGADIYSTSWNELTTNATKTAVPSTVSPNSTVTMSGSLPAMAPGQYYVCWDMLLNGTTSFYSTYDVPTGCAEFTSADTPPQIDSTNPVSDVTLGSLTPELFASGEDPDDYPGSGLTFDFQVYSNPPSGTPALLADSGDISTADWVVPGGTLDWNQSYYWIVADDDGDAASAWSDPSSFTTAVPQPSITSHLGAAGESGSGRDVDPQVGDYTTSATDADVSVVGPPLDIKRSYNSLDPRTSTLFGSGWSTPYDMSVQPDDDASGNVVVTGADGRQQRFGRNGFELDQITGAGDQSGDGIDDVVAVDQTSGKLWLYKGPDYSALTRQLVGTSGWNGMAWLTGGDVTGDRTGDLIGVQSSDGTLWMYPGQSGGGYGSRVEIGTSGWSGMKLLAITPALGSDGTLDLIADQTATGELWAYPVSSGGTSLGTRIEVGTSGWNGMSDLTGGDFNADGHGDLLTIEASTGDLWLYPGTGSGTLGARVELGTGWQNYRDLAPVNGISGDTATDFLATNGTTGVQYLYHSASSFSGPSRTGTGMAVYTAPAGQFETLASLPGASGGWELADKSGTTYTFGQETDSAWKLTGITDTAGHTETLKYDSDGALATITNTTSGRALHLTWSGGHVTEVDTDPATSGGSPETWKYGYTGDDLSSVCPPTSATACTHYSYTSGSASGSHYRSTVVDANPSSYWRLGESSGSTAASEVAVNEGTDNGTYSSSGVSFGATGPLPGSPTKAPAFDGSAGYVSLPNSLLTSATYASIGLWFKTTGSGVLFSYQKDAVTKSTTAGSYTPALYVGTSGKLYGELWQTSGVAPITTASTVADGNWHQAVLTAAGNTQSLYLDGSLVGTLSGQIEVAGQPVDAIGTGFLGGGWPDEPHSSTTDNTGYASHFAGQIAEAAFYTHPLGSPAIQQQYAAGAHAADELDGITLPSGKSQFQAAYDAVNDRVQHITDSNGGDWGVGTPATVGSSAYYQDSVLSSWPGDYFPLDNTSGTQAVNEAQDSTAFGPRFGTPTATFGNVTLGDTGMFTGGPQTAVTLNGTSSSIALIDGFNTDDTVALNYAVELWFKTTTAGGVLFGYQSDPIGTTPTGNYTPALYVGSDGHLYGQYWDGHLSPMESSATVTDGKWHQAVLSIDDEGDGQEGQELYLDGKQVDDRSGDIYDSKGENYVYIGAGYIGGSWPAKPTVNPQGYFKGSLAEFATYGSLDASAVAAHYAARGAASGATPATTVQVTDPTQKTLTYRYDPGNGGRSLDATDALGGTTAYAYDADGFLATVTDPDGNSTTTTHNARGDVLSTTKGFPTIGDTTTTYDNYPSANTYSVTDPRNDEMTSTEDGRSFGPTDTRYATDYTYSSTGAPLSTTDADGNATYRTYTDGTEAAIGGGTEPPGLRKTSKDARGQVTAYAYDSAGDLMKTTAPSGLTVTYAYDLLGRRTSQIQSSDTFPDGVTTTYTYDGQDRLSTTTGPATTDAVRGTTHTQHTAYGYDDDGDLQSWDVSDTTGGDTERDTTWTYNALDEVESVTDPAQRTTSYTYDEYGNRKTETDADGNDYAFGYSPTGELLSTTLTNFTGDPENPTDPTSLVIDARQYDPAGLLAGESDPMGRTTFYFYDSADRVRQLELEPDPDSRNSLVGAQLAFYGYDDAGHMTESVDRDSAETDYTIDPAGRTTKAVFDQYEITAKPLDRVTTYGYDGDGNISTESLTDGTTSEQTDFTYDTFGNPLTKTVHNGDTDLVSSWTYDQRGLMTSSTDPRGNASGADASAYTTDYTEDEAARLTQAMGPQVTAESDGTQGQPVRPLTTYGYDTFGDRTTVEDPDGDITTNTYDTDSEQVAISAPAYTAPGASSAITPSVITHYDADGRPLTVTDGRNDTTHYTYDQLGDLAQVVQPEVDGSSPTTHATYDDDGEPLSVTDPTGAETEATYDLFGDTQTVSSVVRQPTPRVETTTYGYDGNGYLDDVILPGQQEYTAVNDAAGDQLSATDPLSHTTSFSYNANGQVTSTTLPDGTSTTNGYDPAGRLTATADLNASGQTLSSQDYGYDEAGDLTSFEDGDQHTTHYAYDALGDLNQQTEPVSDTASITTSFGHDAAGNQTRYTDGDKNSTYTTYNTLGLPESTIEPSTTDFPNATDRTTTIAYDGNGEPTTVARPGGVTQTNGYDALGRVTSQTGSGAEASTTARSFGYDADGRLTSSGAPGGTNTYTYDDDGDILSSNGPQGSAQYGYGDNGQLLSRTDKSGTADFTYNDDGTLHTTTDPLTATTSTYGYNTDGQVTGISYGDTGAADQTFGYNDQHQLTSDTLTAPGGTTEASTGYDYDNAGRLKTLTTTGLAGAATNTYGYDDAGRLTTWNKGSTTTTYGYDDAGNRIGVTDGSTSTTATYNARDELTGSTTGSTTTTYHYTARGTLSSTTGSSTEDLTADAFDQLTADGSTSYTHDDLGRLTSDGSRTLTYDGTGDAVVSDGTETYGRGPDGELDSVSDGSNATLAYTDQHGDLTGTFTATGTAMTGSTAYDPFGQTTATSGTQHDLGYQGGWTDPSTGRVATASRWYDPSTGDFTSQDTTSQTPIPSVASNGYAYGDDDPMDAADPSGDSACSTGGYAPAYPSGSSHGYHTSSGGGGYQSYNWASKVSAMEWENARRDSGSTSSRRGHRGGGGFWDAVGGLLSVFGSTAWGVATNPVTEEVGLGIFALAAGSDSCNVVAYTPPPPPPPTAQDGLHENPGARPSGQPKGNESPKQNGTAGPDTGPSDAPPAKPHGTAPASVTSPSAHKPVINGTAVGGSQQNGPSGGLGDSDPVELGGADCVGGLLGYQCGGGGNLIDPVTGASLCSPFGAGLMGNTCLAQVPGSSGELTGSPDAGGTSARCSFSPDTPVLMAKGKTEPIGKIKPGEKVEAADPKTGKHVGTRKVLATWVNHDHDLLDVTIVTSGHRQATLHTTSNHPFWNDTTHSWVPAGKLTPGQHLITAADTDVTVAAVTPRTGTANRDNLTVDQLHTYYVLAGNVPVLVHNINIVSPGTCATATVSPQQLADDARALHDTVGVGTRADRATTVATGQLGGDLVYAVNQNGTSRAMRALADQLGYERVFATELTPQVHTDAEQILFNAIDEGEYPADGIIASSRPACRISRQNCAGRADDYPGIALYDDRR